jgi:MinD superfamily P-loop ATPase
MKQVVIISGKGGTGKTVMAASLAVLAENNAIADCDVDAANLHFFLNPEILEAHDFYGNKKARIIPDACTACGRCLEVCRFDALHDPGTGIPDLDRLSCEGCAVCYHICPAEAITMESPPLGEWYLSRTDHGYFVHAKLGIAEENSGKLVALVRKQAQEIAAEHDLDTVIVDGPPGIGCPVIASLAGADLALVVAEPTPSGIQDMERVLKTAGHFHIKTACCINKFDLNLDLTQRIVSWCARNSIPVMGKIPYDTQIIAAVIKGIPPPLYLDDNAAAAFKNVWEKLREFLTSENSS